MKNKFRTLLEDHMMNAVDAQTDAFLAADEVYRTTDDDDPKAQEAMKLFYDEADAAGLAVDIAYFYAYQAE